MKKDYHMHPMAAQNADRFDGFARQAIASGIQEVCITDHMPLSISNAGDRIPAGKVTEYCQTVRRLACKYEGKLSVKLGIEIDYHPDCIAEIEAVLKSGEFDFVIGASHPHLFYDLRDITYNEFAEISLKNSLLAAQSGYFDAIAHLDFYRWHFTLPKRFPLLADDYSYEKHIPLFEQVLNTIRDEGMCLEINPHLAEIKQSLSFTYPEEEIVQMALEKGLQFCYGSDAHAPEMVGSCLEQLRAHSVYGQAIQKWESES